jgi:7-cyano-7-deazaguanine synthase
MLPKAVVVCSGGMDSATLAYHYKARGFDPLLVGFDYGQRHKKELESLAKIAEVLDAEYRIVDLSVLREHLSGSSLTSDDIEVPDGHYAEETMKATVVPNRNAIMLSVATGIAVSIGARIVATGIHSGDHFIYPDCRPEFFEAMRKAMKEANEGHAVEGFDLEAPFLYMFKSDIAQLGGDLEVDYSITWSCYKGGDIHCGSCGTCYERREAFIVAKVSDPTEYEALPDYVAP